MSEDQESKLITLIRTKDQPWLNDIAKCVIDQNIERLDKLVSPKNADFTALTAGLDDDDDGVEDEFTKLCARPCPGRAARGVVALARSVLEPRERKHLLIKALNIFEDNGIACAPDPAPGSLPGKGHSSHKRDLADLVLNVLHGIDSPATGFVDLLVKFLMGDFPERSGRPVQLPVLLEVRNASDQNDLNRTGLETGLGALLRLERLREGPPGLYADPRTMTFTQCDQNFKSALEEAWRISGLAGTGACVVWALFDGDDILDRVGGSSMGAAFAVGLDDLAPRTRIRRMLRLKKLDPTCAVTGQLSGRKILPVKGYEGKLRAAARNRWRVVVPKESKTEINNDLNFIKILPASSVDYAENISQAIKYSRRIVDKKLISGVLVIVLVLAGFVGVGAMVNAVRQRQIYEQELRTKSAELANFARDERQSSPRLAALAALAGYRMDPSVNSARALRMVSEEYPAVVGTMDAHDSRVTEVTHVGNFIISGDSGGTVSLWTDKMKLSSSLELGAEVLSLDGSVDGTLAVATVNNYIVFLGVSDEGELTERVRERRENFTALSRLSGIVSITIAPNGSEVRFLDENGLMARCDPYGNLLDYADIKSLLGKNESGKSIRITASSLFMGGYLPDDTCGGDCILLGTDEGGVYLYDFDSGSTRFLFDMITRPQGEEIRALACDDSVIAIGTVHGVRVWDQTTGEMTDLPLPSENSVVHDVIMSWSGQIVVLVGGVSSATTALYFATDQRVAATQTISSTAVGAASNFEGIVVGTSDGRLVILSGEEEDRNVMVQTVATTAMAVTAEGEIVQTFGSPMDIQGVRIIGLDDTKKEGYTVVQELKGPDAWVTASEGWYVNSMDVRGDLIAVSGLTPRQDSGSIVVWDRRVGEVVATFTLGTKAGSENPPIVTQVKFLGEGGLIAGYDFSSGDLFIFALKGQNPDDQNGLIARRHLGGGLGGMAYCEANGMLYALTWPEGEDLGVNHEVLAIDAASGLTRWTLPVGGAARIAVNPLTGDIAVPDGATLTIYSGEDHTILRQGELPAPAQRVAWSPDGSMLAAAEAGGGLDIVDAGTLAQTVPTIWVGEGLDFSDFMWRPDSRTLIVGTISEDYKGTRQGGDTYVVRADATNWTNRMCAIAGSSLSEAEWEEYVGDVLPYEELCPA